MLLHTQIVYFQFFFLPVLRHIRAATRESIPVIAWAVIFAPALLRFLGPRKFGGYGDLANQARELAETSGRNFDDILDEVGAAFYSCPYNARDRLLTVDAIPTFSCITLKTEKC